MSISMPRINKGYFIFFLFLFIGIGGVFAILFWRTNTPERTLIGHTPSSIQRIAPAPLSTTSSFSTATEAKGSTTTVERKPENLPPRATSIWRPKIGATFDWLEDSSLANLPASHRDMYIVDAFDVTAATIASLHKQGARVICYINAGSWEDWRSDKTSFPESILGNDYEGWEGERWLDIKSAALKPIMRKRFDLAKSKGCDAIDPDNIDGYENDTGFSISKTDQVAYNLWLATEAHKRSMSIGLKNGIEMIASLVGAFDWALIEDCADQDWCADFRPFTARGKAVLQVEYTDNNLNHVAVCAAAKANKFSALFKHRNLSSWADYCQK